jgi:hypothetical protein
MVEREVLQKHLLKEEQKYLSRILGLLGPSNVLEPYIKAALQDKHVFEKVNSAGRVIPVDPDSFFEKLKLIHNELSKLASCHPLPDLSKQTKKPSILNLKSPGGSYKTSENIHLPLDSHDPLELLQILAPQYIYLHSTNKISEHENLLLEDFGGCDELKSALEMIEDLDFHKRFMQEWKSESFQMILSELPQ